MNIPRMNYPQYRKARRLTHECCNYCNGNCLLLDDGEECVCVQSISYSLLCRWFKVAVLPLDAALCAEITKGRDEIKRCAVCGAAFTPNSNRAKYCPDCAVQIRRKKEAARQRKKIPPVYAFRAVKVHGNQGFFRMVGRQVDKVILFPLKRGSKCGKMDKKRSAGRRGFDSLRARRFAYSSVKWNRCATKSASLMASSLSAVWQASAAISLSMSGKAARRFAAVLRRSALWYRQIRFSSSTVKYIPHTSISF